MEFEQLSCGLKLRMRFHSLGHTLFILQDTKALEENLQLQKDKQEKVSN